MTPFMKQAKECHANGTIQKATRELYEKLPPADKEICMAVFDFRSAGRIKYRSFGPMLCGKKPGICSARHCKAIHEFQP